MVSKATSPIVSLHVATMDEDEDDESDGVKPILSNRNVSLSVQDVESLLVFREKCSQMPFLPKGGEVYIFRPEKSIQSRDWVSDGHW